MSYLPFNITVQQALTKIKALHKYHPAPWNTTPRKVLVPFTMFTGKVQWKIDARYTRSTIHTYT